MPQDSKRKSGLGSKEKFMQGSVKEQMKNQLLDLSPNSSQKPADSIATEEPQVEIAAELSSLSSKPEPQKPADLAPVAKTVAAASAPVRVSAVNEMIENLRKADWAAIFSTEQDEKLPASDSDLKSVRLDNQTLDALDRFLKDNYPRKFAEVFFWRRLIRTFLKQCGYLAGNP